MKLLKHIVNQLKNYYAPLQQILSLNKVKFVRLEI